MGKNANSGLESRKQGSLPKANKDVRRRMAKKLKTNTKNVERFLINLEKQIGKPIVVSLLIEQSKISFLSATKKKLAMFDEDDSDDEPDFPTKKIKSSDKLKHSFESAYIS